MIRNYILLLSLLKSANCIAMRAKNFRPISSLTILCANFINQKLLSDISLKKDTSWFSAERLPKELYALLQLLQLKELEGTRYL